MKIITVMEKKIFDNKNSVFYTVFLMRTFVLKQLCFLKEIESLNCNNYNAFKFR